MRNSLAYSALQSRALSAASPPPPALPAQESYLSGTSGQYVEEMYEAWAQDPGSVHASWDAYFRGGVYQVFRNKMREKLT